MESKFSLSFFLEKIESETTRLIITVDFYFGFGTCNPLYDKIFFDFNFGHCRSAATVEEKFELLCYYNMSINLCIIIFYNLLAA